MEIFKPDTNKLSTILISIMLIVGMLLCLYSPKFLIFNLWSKHAMQITIGYWLLGLFFLFIKQQRLTLVAFGCCVALCLYLRNNTNSALEAPTVTNEPKFSISHFNLSETSSNFRDVISIIKQSNADIISLQEITPDWNPLLKDSIASIYPFSCEVGGFNFHSSRMYSKYKFIYCDTFYTEGVPNLVMGFPNGYNNDLVYIVNSYIEPPIFEKAYEMMQHQLSSIGQYIKNLNSPALAVGDYNIQSFSYEIRNFREIAKLTDSRRGYRPDRNDGRISFLEVPFDHIFHTGHFSCIEFQTIIGKNSERLGIKGLYQFNKDSMFVNQKTINTTPQIGLQTQD